MTTLDERHGEGAPRGEAALGLAEAQRARVQEAREAQARAAVPLEDPGAALPRSAGSKAANLARAARAGLPVLPGFVIPHLGGTDTIALRRAWDELSEGGSRPLVVRSSSPQEDTDASSLAGRFASVLDVRGWPAFRAAVRAVLDSAHRPDGSTAPMAVLVQPMLAARVGGVMFGADPVAGRTDRMLVSAVRGGPDSLVSGAEAGTNHWLSARGRLLRTEPNEAGARLTRAELFRLARLARRARRVFGGPQDIEFGFDGDGRLWLFQSRPITAMAARPVRGARLLGPGPVAETLPGQLAPLEEDLWVTPMDRGLAAALDIGGSASRRLLRTVPVVTTVGGRATADLRLLGAAAPAHRWLALLNPAPGARRLAAAWRVGRLGTALPGLATDLVADVDRRLGRIPSAAGLPGPVLAAELRWTRQVLVSLHAQEALAGALLREPPRARTAAGTALAALADARAQGVPDDRMFAAAPVVLALTAPSLRTPARLPQTLVPGQGATGQVGTARDSSGEGSTGKDSSGQGSTGRGVASQAGTGQGSPGEETTGQGTTGQENPGQGNPGQENPGQATSSAPPTGEGSQTSTGAHTGPANQTGTGNRTGTGSQTSAGNPPTAGSPPGTANPAPPSAPSPSPALPPREALRLRVRWVQELQVRLVREAARRLGLGAERVELLRWPELAAVLDGGAALPADVHARVARTASPPLPDAFRLAEGEVVVAERDGGFGEGGHGDGAGGRGVSGGRAVGTVWDGAAPRPQDPVLVVRTLDPAFAPLLPGLTGLVAQTGSPLSHLAVLAREFGLPAVVGAADAVRRFPAGPRRNHG
ncbi:MULTISPECIES: PEP/pyruvate-binding domain-containing protein [Streptomyces]|uniref:PEP/pyruvate-binding domain-containing protein n=2 Tax=Streptomyces TaxID=1883 RepID=A0ABV9J3T4_9ACTN